MTNFRLFSLKNNMLGANFMANLIGVFFAQVMSYRITPSHLPDEIASILNRINAVFSPSAFILVVVVTLIYERPIRRYLNCKYRNTEMPHELQINACRRVINEPFVMMALDFSMWLSAAILFSTVLWASDAEPILIQRAFFRSLNIGLITVTVAFFLLEHVLQKKLAPHFFPEGGLYTIPKTLRIRIRTRLVALLFACNLLPFFSILHAFYYITSSRSDPAWVVNQLRAVIFIYSFVFVSVGIFLTMLVGRNLTTPFKEIMITLRGVKNGRFDKKVQVTTNDEIGYTGDVINEMTEGLKEGEVIKDAFGKYVAQEIRDEVLSGRIPLDGEKKDVTVLFSDLRNFTLMTESNDPKLVIKIMNSYFKEMAEAIQDQGGLVLQFIGDEIYAVFGAPISRPDHPARAFRAGLEMGRRLVELNRDFQKKSWPCLRHGIGIHTGAALAANIGSPDRLSYLLVGDTINLASRLQSLTKEMGNDMIISSATYTRLTESERVTAEFRQLPPTTVRGKKQSVGIFAVT
ncbi:HAMP domain-containing protein [Candidatus Saccharibacteria bacterium]|nr:HAMP domain-containing protein [candidate division Zixibacteria bacterium]NIT03904.1 HAMP domain-containing protein [Candidatus Saccharibacteria bacterium]